MRPAKAIGVDYGRIMRSAYCFYQMNDDESCQLCLRWHFFLATAINKILLAAAPCLLFRRERERERERESFILIRLFIVVAAQHCSLCIIIKLGSYKRRKGKLDRASNEITSCR